MTEKRARAPLSKVRIPYFEREYTPVKPVRARVRFKTVDDVVFELCDTSIVPSTYMNRLIYGSRVNRQQSTDIPHPLPNVAADVFEKVMRYCYFHTSRYCDSLLPNEVKEWDDEFMDLDPRQLCELASAAYYLDVKDLIELTCRAIAAIISGKTAEQIRKTFHIEDDLAGTIDRVLPSNARRRGREHSPREHSRSRDSKDNNSHELNETDAQQENPGAQKSIDELMEWINSSSSKSKKKKKKRHRDKNPAKKDGDCRGNDDEVCDSETVRTASAEGKVPDVSVKRQEPSTAVNEIPHDHDHPAGVKERPKEPERIATSPRLSGELRTAFDSDHDAGSSSSDIAFVSEKLVDHLAVEERRASLRANAIKESESLGRADQPNSTPTVHIAEQHEASMSVASDGDSVQYVPPNSSSQPHFVNQETSVAASSGDEGESCESDAGSTSPRKRPSQVGNEERGKESFSEGDASPLMNTEERESDPISQRPVKEDVAMIDATENPSSQPALPSQHPSDERFIDCPENMDREVEAFQQRLSITEPLSSHRSAPQARNTRPPVNKKESNNLPASMNTGGSWNTNGAMTEGLLTSRPRGRPGSSDERTVMHVSHERRNEISPSSVHSAVMKHSSIPKEALAELLRINSEKEEFQKIAAAIDEETARLGAKREKVRDSLAVLNMQERQLRLKYNVSDRFP